MLEYWVKVQSAWIYLEPIFGHEDIRRQIPQEGVLFEQVDENFKDIMENSIKDTRALVVSNQNDILDKLEFSVSMLDTINKGLNNYLEEKRLFFPRFFFLSNDELLEILSETKDPKRVQPHLKKCFEGIKSLTFSSDEVIEAMQSAENEMVRFTKEIIPKEAHGLVEIWLRQVEEVMKLSLHSEAKKAINQPAHNDRFNWISSFPGQIVLAINIVDWTAEVTDVI